MAGQVFASGGPAHAAAGAGEEAEHVGDGRQLVVQGSGVGLAAVLRFQAGQFLCVGVYLVRQLQQQGGAVLGRGLRPGREGGIGGTHGGVDLGRAGLGDLHQGGAQGRVEYGEAGAFTGDELAVDQELGLHGLGPRNYPLSLRGEG
ncbi:hypothetical protein D9M71_584710 [compost metagenome]